MFINKRPQDQWVLEGDRSPQEPDSTEAKRVETRGTEVKSILSPSFKSPAACAAQAQAAQADEVEEVTMAVEVESNVDPAEVEEVEEEVFQVMPASEGRPPAGKPGSELRVQKRAARRTHSAKARGLGPRGPYPRLPTSPRTGYPGSRPPNRRRRASHLRPSRQDEIRIGGRDRELRHAEKVHEKERQLRDPFNQDNAARGWYQRSTTNTGDTIMTSGGGPRVQAGYGRRVNPNSNNFRGFKPKKR
eukprot:g28476.t1